MAAARDRERWLATELLAPHAAYFLARHQWRKMRARGADATDIVPVAQKILGALAEPMEIGRQLLSVNTSLGIAVYPRDGETADTLASIKHAGALVPPTSAASAV